MIDGRIVIAGCLAADFGLLLAILTISNLDRNLTDATVCFACAVPALTACALMAETYSGSATGAPSRGHLYWLTRLTLLIGTSASVVGLGFCLSHLSMVAGVVYLFSCAAGAVLVISNMFRMEKRHHPPKT